MNRRWIAAAVLVAALLGVGGWFSYRAFEERNTPAPVHRVEQVVPDGVPPAASGIETIDAGEDAVANGGTPMAQRVAVLGLLNKRNGESREITLKPGQATRIGDVVVRLRACEKTAPWEQDQLTGAFAQVIVRGSDAKWRRTFSGWLFKERPGLNVVQHPIYDVWTKSCTMSFPDKGADTEALTSPKRSSAPKSASPSAAGSAGGRADGPADDDAPVESAASSNAT